MFLLTLRVKPNDLHGGFASNKGGTLYLFRMVTWSSTKKCFRRLAW